MMFKKKSNEASQWMKDNAPHIAFWVASVILVLFDIRVLDVVYRLTNQSPLLAGGSLFATALMFFIWKTAFQYTLSSKTQSTLASVGMALSLLASAVYGGMDYFVKGGLTIDTGAGEFGAVDLVFWGIPILSVVHVIMLLAYWYLDPVVSAERNRKEADDDHAFTAREMKHAKELLEKQKGIIEEYVSTAQKYGKQAALQQLDLLGIDRAAFENIEIPPAMTEPAPAPASMTGHGNSQPLSMTMPQPSMTNIPQPAPVMAGANGNGHNVNPTQAGSVV